MFTVRYGLIPYTKQIRLVFKSLKLRIEPTQTYDCLTNESPRSPLTYHLFPHDFLTAMTHVLALEISPKNVSELLESQALKTRG